ncbi:hypothetical protein HY449_02775 [Candidatus Pacearchaeota archaeon]|nr:hypothetical protein [Candidatus Pacearchaeota archaeon]
MTKREYAPGIYPHFRTFVDESDPGKPREKPTVSPIRYEMGERETPRHPDDVEAEQARECRGKLKDIRVKQILDKLKGN